MTISFEINDLPKTTNSGGRAHWALKVREAKKWKKMVLEQLIAKDNWQQMNFPFQKAKLTLTRYSSKEPDFDGLVSSFKHVIDGLKEAGVIIDDKVSVIDQPIYLWSYARPRQGKIKVEVESV